MVQLVDAEDVQDRLLGRTLTDDEKSTLNMWIGDLISDIRIRIPDLNTMAEDDDYLALLKRAVYSAVKRVLDNPRGLRQSSVTIDDYTRSETVDSSASEGKLYLSDDDWALLIPALDADEFSIRLGGTPGFAEY